MAYKTQTNKQEQGTKKQIYDPNQEAKSACGDSHSRERGMSENTKYYKNCQLFKAELVKMNWKVSKECLFALLFIMATALYKLPYTNFFFLPSP